MAHPLLRKLQKLQSPEVLASVLRRSIDKIIAPRLRGYDGLRSFFEAKTGLELGGPSELFRRRGLFPIYPLAARIDNCNFSTATVWQGQIAGGASFRYDKRREPGQQFFAEATQLGFAPGAAYDFVLASHMLEHSANALEALHEWKRVLKPHGALLLVLPHKDGTFDHKRPVTSLQHFVQDFERQIGEDDLTHLPEILQRHDLQMDPGGGSLEQFKARSEKNFENRCLHHHVFDTRRAVELVDLVRLQIHAVETARPYHIAILATNTPDPASVRNEPFLGHDVEYERRSPFPSDRADERR